MGRGRVETDSVVFVALVAVIAYAAFFFPLLRNRDGDISRFVVSGNAVDPQRVPPGLTVRRDISGYDGVAFYRLALDPLTRTRSAYGITLDIPEYRQQRIGYPLLVHLLALGRPAWIPLCLVLINFVGIAVLGALGGRIAQQLELHAMWGLIFPFYPGFLITLSRDLSEIIACAFVLAAVWAVHASRFTAAGLLLAGGILTRETVLGVALALAAAFTLDLLLDRPRHIAPIAFLLPILICATWQFVLALIWGSAPLIGEVPALTVPFVEYGRLVAASSSVRGLARLYFSEALFLAVVTVMVIAVWRTSRARIEWKLAWVGYLALGATLPHGSWGEDVAFLRILAEYFIFGAIVVIAATKSARMTLFAVTAPVWYYVASHTIKYG